MYLQKSCSCLLLATAFLMCKGLSVRADDAGKWVFDGRTMGPIQYRVVVARPPEPVKKNTLKLVIQDSLDRVNALMSTWLTDSDVGRFNRSKSTDWIAVESETATVVARALEITVQTDGAFNIRVAPVVDRWKFGPLKAKDKNADFVVPTTKETQQLLKLISEGEIETRQDPPALKKSLPEIRIDLSAIAKGYAVDRVGAALVKAGCKNFMVEVGGEVVVLGERFEGGPWRVGIENPDRQTRSIRSVVELSEGAVATSGDYRNFFQHKGKRYSHTIDPATCRPVEHHLASACVIASDCLTADAIATAVMVKGASDGHQLAERLGVLLYTIDRDGSFDGELIDRASDKFPLKDDFPAKTARSGTVSTAGATVASIWPAFIASIIVISLAILGMAVGAIVANKPVRGSCGGLSAATGADGEDASCGVCAKPVTDCVEQANQS